MPASSHAVITAEEQSYYDIIPEKLFNPVSIYAYFYTEFLDVKNIQSQIDRLLGNASLPDGVTADDINMSEAGEVLIIGHEWIIKPPVPLNPTPAPLEEFTYGNFWEVDNETNLKDAIYIMQYLPALTDQSLEKAFNLSLEAKAAADVDDDGDISSVDATLIAHYVSKTQVHYNKDDE